MRAEAVGTQPILMDKQRVKTDRWRFRDPESTSASLVVVLGAAFTVVGVVDLALLWTPLQLGNPAWEFTTLTQTFTNVPMTGLGLMLMAYGLVRHPRWGPAWVRAAAVTFAAIALLLVGLALMYATVVPAIVQRTPAEAIGGIGEAIVKSGAETLVYPLAFGALSFFLWRAVERKQV